MAKCRNCGQEDSFNNGGLCRDCYSRVEFCTECNKQISHPGLCDKCQDRVSKEMNKDYDRKSW
jgi:hypothetical protein